jgi:uncharacterized protein (TIGR03083 family)
MTDISPTPSAEVFIAALHNAHERLRKLVEPLTDDELRGQSYDTEWSLAQVLSHMGSGTDVFSLFLQAGLDGETGPGIDAIRPIWDRWNAKTPADQARDAVLASATFIGQLDALDDEQRAGWQIDMFGEVRTIPILARMRLSELAVHTWDVAVALDPTATLPPDAVELLVDTVAPIARYMKSRPEQPIVAALVTHDPVRSFEVRADSDGVVLEPTDRPPSERPLRLSAEAYIRLIYGRLDAAHTPAIETGDVDLDVLRALFPGF